MTEVVQANPYLDARLKVALALAGLPWGVHESPPEVIVPPCIVIYPARSGWITSPGYTSLLVRCVAQSLPRLEDMLHRTRTLLRQSGFGPGDVDSADVAAERVYADIPIKLRTASM